MRVDEREVGPGRVDEALERPGGVSSSALFVNIQTIRKKVLMEAFKCDGIYGSQSAAGVQRENTVSEYVDESRS